MGDNVSVTSPYNPSTGDRRNGTPAGPVATPGGPPAGGDRLPRPPRRRRPGFAALAVLLIAGSAAAAGLLAVRLDDRVPVLVAGKEIPVGKEIERADLASARVASSDIATIPTGDIGLVVGRYATQTIPAGRLIDEASLGEQSLLRAGTVALGVVLKPGNVPASGLQAGDKVKVYRAKDGEGSVLIGEATVSSVSSQENDGGLGGGGGGGETEATIIVEDSANGDVSARIGAASLAGQIVLGLVERGGSAGD